jgi:hypothetical protein
MELSMASNESTMAVLNMIMEGKDVGRSFTTFLRYAILMRALDGYLGHYKASEPADARVPRDEGKWLTGIGATLTKQLNVLWDLPGVIRTRISPLQQMESSLEPQGSTSWPSGFSERRERLEAQLGHSARAASTHKIIQNLLDTAKCMMKVFEGAFGGHGYVPKEVENYASMEERILAMSILWSPLLIFLDVSLRLNVVPAAVAINVSVCFFNSHLAVAYSLFRMQRALAAKGARRLRRLRMSFTLSFSRRRSEPTSLFKRCVAWLNGW